MLTSNDRWTTPFYCVLFMLFYLYSYCFPFLEKWSVLARLRSKMGCCVLGCNSRHRSRRFCSTSSPCRCLSCHRNSYWRFALLAPGHFLELHCSRSQQVWRWQSFHQRSLRSKCQSVLLFLGLLCLRYSTFGQLRPSCIWIRHGGRGSQPWITSQCMGRAPCN